MSVNGDYSLFQRGPYIEQIANEPYPFISRAIRSDRRLYNPDFIRYMTLSSFQSGQSLPPQLRTIPFIQALFFHTQVSQEPKLIQRLIQSLPKAIHNHPEFILALIQGASEPIRQELLQSLPESLKGISVNAEFIRTLIAFLPDEMRSDPLFLGDLMKTAADLLGEKGRMKVFYSILKNCSDELQQNVEFLSAMMQFAAKDSKVNTVLFLIDAPEDLRNNMAYVIAVVSHSSMALVAAPDEDLDNPNYIRGVVQVVPKALQYAPPEFRADADFLLSVLEEATDDQLSNPELYKALIRYAEKPLKTSPEYVEAILGYVPGELRQNPYFIHAILSEITFGREEAWIELQEALLGGLVFTNLSGG